MDHLKIYTFNSGKTYIFIFVSLFISFEYSYFIIIEDFKGEFVVIWFFIFLFLVGFTALDFYINNMYFNFFIILLFIVVLFSPFLNTLKILLVIDIFFLMDFLC